MKNLLIALAIATTSTIAIAGDKMSVEVTCWNNSGVQILKVKAQGLSSDGNRDTAGIIHVYTTSSYGDRDPTPDYTVYGGTCVAKKI